MGFLNVGLSWLIAALQRQCTFQDEGLHCLQTSGDSVSDPSEDCVCQLSGAEPVALYGSPGFERCPVPWSLYVHFVLMVIADPLDGSVGLVKAASLLISLSSACCRGFASILPPFPMSFLLLEYNREVLLSVGIGMSAVSRVCLSSRHCGWLV